jgi:hypothetical protein
MRKQTRRKLSGETSRSMSARSAHAQEREMTAQVRAIAKARELADKFGLALKEAGWPKNHAQRSTRKLLPGAFGEVGAGSRFRGNCNRPVSQTGCGPLDLSPSGSSFPPAGPLGPGSARGSGRPALVRMPPRRLPFQRLSDETHEGRTNSTETTALTPPCHWRGAPDVEVVRLLSGADAPVGH